MPSQRKSISIINEILKKRSFPERAQGLSQTALEHPQDSLELLSETPDRPWASGRSKGIIYALFLSIRANE